MSITIIERHEALGNKYAQIEVGGKRYWTAVEQGKRVRIPYKPRGRNIGYQWWGAVRDEKANTIWEGRVNKNTGPLALAKAANLC